MIKLLPHIAHVLVCIPKNVTGYIMNGFRCQKLLYQEVYVKQPSRTDIINYLLSIPKNEDTTYLEIGVRNPNDNYDHIIANTKYSVDPGVEYEKNPVDFKMTSDAFFDELNNGKILSPEIRFDVIFIDGLHLAEQVNRDIKNALQYIKEDGFIVLHDCNPPTTWHAREDYYTTTPALTCWNGTVWKAFLKWRFDTTVQSCCIDTDWGVGVLSKNQPIGDAILEEANPFFEYNELATHRKKYLNLISYEDLKQRLHS